MPKIPLNSAAVGSTTIPRKIAVAAVAGNDLKSPPANTRTIASAAAAPVGDLKSPPAARRTIAAVNTTAAPPQGQPPIAVGAFEAASPVDPFDISEDDLRDLIDSIKRDNDKEVLFQPSQNQDQKYLNLISPAISNLIAKFGQMLRDEILKNSNKKIINFDYGLDKSLPYSIENYLLKLTPFLIRCVGDELENLLLDVYRDIQSYLAYNRSDFLNIKNVYHLIAISLRARLEIYNSVEYSQKDFLLQCELITPETAKSRETTCIEIYDDLEWGFFREETLQLFKAIEKYLLKNPNFGKFKTGSIEKYLLDYMNENLTSFSMLRIQSVMINMLICVDRCLEKKITRSSGQLLNGFHLLEVCLSLVWKADAKVLDAELQFMSSNQRTKHELTILKEVNVPIVIVSHHPQQRKYREMLQQILVTNEISDAKTMGNHTAAASLNVRAGSTSSAAAAATGVARAVFQSPAPVKKRKATAVEEKASATNQSDKEEKQPQLMQPLDQLRNFAGVTAAAPTFAEQSFYSFMFHSYGGQILPPAKGKPITPEAAVPTPELPDVTVDDLDFDDKDWKLPSSSASDADKAAAILLAMRDGPVLKKQKTTDAKVSVATVTQRPLLAKLSGGKLPSKQLTFEPPVPRLTK